MTYSQAFIDAFNHVMLYEVGPWWNPADPGVIAGTCDTQAQCRMVGLTNTPGDGGGLTKYGIAITANPGVDVQHLDLAGAMEIYFKNYWLAGKCDQLTAEPIAVIAFDICVNNGVGRSAKMLQQAVGATVDGQIGPNTLAAVNGADVDGLIRKLNDLRVARYNTIVMNDPTQQKFINGWMRRVSEVTQYALSLSHA